MKKGLEIIVSVLIVAALIALVYVKINEQNKIEKQSIGDFVEFLQSDKATKKTVKDLKLNEYELKVSYTYKKKEYTATYPRNYIVEKPEILDTLKEKKIEYEIINTGNKTANILMTIVKVLFYGVFILILYVMIKDMIGGGFDIKEVEGEKTTFKDIAGYEYVKEELQEIVDFIKNPEKYEKYTDKVPKGILLEGPPGNGKTFFAKAVAGETDTPFFQISASDIEDKYVGSGARRIEKIFKTVREKAKESGKVILFIDEIDAVGMKRENRTVQETNQTINKLLTEMDGFEKDSKVIIIGATNLSSTLDEALIRAGRFDRIIKINRPTTEEREAVIKLYLDKKGDLIADEVKEQNYAKTLAEQTEGFSNADLDKLVNESSLISRKKEEEHISIKSLREGFTKIVAGVKTNHRVTEEDLKIVAYHEAGHLVSRILTHPHGYKGVAYATITPHGESLGHVSPIAVERMQRKSDIENEIVVCLAGRAVEEKILDGDYTVGAASDLRQANNSLWYFVAKYGMGEANKNLFVEKIDESSEVMQKQIKEERERLYQKTQKMIEENFELIEKVAKYLIANTSIEQYELRDLLKGTSYEIKWGKIED